MATAEFTDHGTHIKSIAESGFEDCKNLRDVDLSKSEITEVPENAFKGCRSLTGIYFPNTLTAFKRDSFSGCNALNNGVFDLTGITVIDKIGDFP